MNEGTEGGEWGDVWKILGSSQALTEQEGRGQAGWGVTTAIAGLWLCEDEDPVSLPSWRHRVMSVRGHRPPHRTAGGLFDHLLWKTACTWPVRTQLKDTIKIDRSQSGGPKIHYNSDRTINKAPKLNKSHTIMD